MKWLKEFALLLVQLLAICAFNKYAMNVSNDFVFLDAVLTILLIDLVNRRANRK
jgi:hypothetical protein